MIAKTKKARVDHHDSVAELASRGGVAKAPRRKTKAGSGVASDDAVRAAAAPAESDGHVKDLVKSVNKLHGPADGAEDASDDERRLASVCHKLQELQRRRAAAIKVKNMGLNQLAAIVSTAMGYSAGLDEEARKAKRAAAEKVIKQVDAGDDFRTDDASIGVAGIILLSRDSRKGMETYIANLEKEMLALAKELPVAEWVEHKDRRGIGLLSIATIIGETGDLSLYAGPAKLWKRMGCAPITSSAGETKMGSTWKMKGGLSADEWSSAGYSPRRRAIMFCIGENIVKQNQEGPYRKHYDAAKASRPEWPKHRSHKHGMLLAVKLLLKELWIEWNNKGRLAA